MSSCACLLYFPLGRFLGTRQDPGQGGSSPQPPGGARVQTFPREGILLLAQGLSCLCF